MCPPLGSERRRDNVYDRAPTTGSHQQRANVELQKLDELKSEFVSMVSHELRTPLTSLTGGLELLLGRKETRPVDRKTLLLMKNEVERLA